MELIDAIELRHSVRSYLDKKLDEKTVRLLEAEVDDVNQESGLNIQLVTNEPEAFSSFMAHYGKFRNVTNYFAMVGKNSKDLQEKVGYFGERLVLFSQTLGLNTCWVALTYNKSKAKVKVAEDEKLVCVIALGFGETQGVAHVSKPLYKFVKGDEDMPEWFMNGVKAASLAPTAINQQKFKFELDGNKVKATAGRGFYAKVDLGIAKLHFEIGAGKGKFEFV